MKVFWFDVETTGLDPDKCGIIQLAYVVEVDGQVKETGELCSRGGQNCEISERALEVNGYTREQIESFPPEREMYVALKTIFGKYVNKFDRADKFIAGGYNVDFDMKFLRALWNRVGDKYFGSWFAFNVIDPSNVIRFLQYSGKIEEFAQMKLVDLAEYLKVGQENAHDASADIQMTIDITKKLEEYLK